VNQSRPSGAQLIIEGVAPAVGSATASTDPATVIRPIAFAPIAVNHSAPSAPAVIPYGPTGAGNVVISTSTVIRPIAFALVAVYQSAPSGPAVICAGWQSAGLS
jgi:hypothetical protein